MLIIVQYMLDVFECATANHVQTHANSWIVAALWRQRKNDKEKKHIHTHNPRGYENK